MSLEVDTKYAKLISLEQFKESQKNYFNFRCPFCGDSKKSKTKKRGWLIPNKEKNGLFFHCFNCQEAMGMSYFIHRLKPELLRDYNRENFIITKTKVENVSQNIQQFFMQVQGDVQKVSSLNIDHAVYKYLQDRYISKIYYDDIYYAQNFKSWINESYIPGKYEYINGKDERVVFPLRTIRGELIGLQGRSLNPNIDHMYRFMTVKTADITDHPLCFNLNRIVLGNLYIIIVEGIFDAIVLKNSIAMLKLQMDFKFIKDSFSSNKIIVAFDNEKRNPDVVRAYKKIAAQEDFGLFIPPLNMVEKDFNDMAVSKKISPEEMTQFVIQNSVFGKLQKNIKLSSWLI